jgi:hypothetical protein
MSHSAEGHAAAGERGASASVLQSNVDDPRFAPTSEKTNTPAEWNAGSALKANLTEPVDTMESVASDPRLWLFGILEAALSAIGEFLGYLLQGLAHH